MPSSSQQDLDHHPRRAQVSPLGKAINFRSTAGPSQGWHFGGEEGTGELTPALCPGTRSDLVAWAPPWQQRDSGSCREGRDGAKVVRAGQQLSRAAGPPSQSFAVSHLPGSHLTPTCILGNIARVNLQRYPINLHPRPKPTPCLSASLPRNALGTLHSSPASCDAVHAEIAMWRVSRE